MPVDPIWYSGIPEKAVQRSQIRVVGTSSTQSRENQEVQGLAEFDDLIERAPGVRLTRTCEENFQLGSRDHSRLSAEGEKVPICRKKVNTSIWIVAIIQCVGEVERYMTVNELKFLCHRFPVPV
jgi:hypothetical protein